MPVEASPRSSAANVSVSAADSPEEGSSSSSTRGWVASARATSTSRAVPVGSSSARVDATAWSPRCSMMVSVMTSGCPAPVRAQRLRCSSAATRMLSRTVSDPKTSRRWKVRARPSRANWCGRAPVTSLPSTKTRPWLGSCMPVATLNSVVLPAPFGPMRPMICPSCRSRLTLLTASRPPKRTLMSRSSTAGRSVCGARRGRGQPGQLPHLGQRGSAAVPAGVARPAAGCLPMIRSRSLTMLWTLCSQIAFRVPADADAQQARAEVGEPGEEGVVGERLVEPAELDQAGSRRRPCRRRPTRRPPPAAAGTAGPR